MDFMSCRAQPHSAMCSFMDLLYFDHCQWKAAMTDNRSIILIPAQAEIRIRTELPGVRRGPPGSHGGME